MKTLKRIQSYKLQIAFSIGAFIAVELAFYDFSADASNRPLMLAAQQSQAKELFGHKRFERQMKDVSYDTLTLVKLVHKHLPKAYKKDSGRVAQVIINEAHRYKLDPMFLVAVILTESSFNPLAKGLHGEIGLMQILPKTGNWLARKMKFKGKVNLKDPATNIRLGASYLALLRDQFEGIGNRYIAAYNMGSLNVKRLVKKNVEPKIYTNKVMAHYLDIYRTLQ